jgi:shikimate dehydrogenase
VLGCGGSARAVLAALTRLAPANLQVAARRPTALAAFLAACSPWAPGLEGIPWQQGKELRRALAEADLVVNTTPVGMAAANDPDAASRSPLDPELAGALRPGTMVYDLIYTPRPTALLRQAEARGCRTLDGLEMLVRQGAAALRRWSGIEEVPVAAMRAAALAQLGPA